MLPTGEEKAGGNKGRITYGSIFGGLGLATLDSEAAAFALEPLGCDEALDLGSFGIGLFAFAFWLYFATDDEFTDLYVKMFISLGFFMIDEIQG